MFVIVVALQPSEFRVARTARMSAPPATVFAQVNDLRKMQAWSPWARMDPAVKNTFEGPSSGTGAVLAWAGNRKIGEGRMTISESRPNELIRIKLDFVRPFPSTSIAEFNFKPEGSQTVVTWSMAGRKASVPKAIGLFLSMDKMIGGEFEKGLASLKSMTEAAAQK
jgi:uncharacterized protein YndB with AHSA1/START domain